MRPGLKMFSHHVFTLSLCTFYNIGLLKFTSKVENRILYFISMIVFTIRNRMNHVGDLSSRNRLIVIETSFVFLYTLYYLLDKKHYKKIDNAIRLWFFFQLGGFFVKNLQKGFYTDAMNTAVFLSINAHWFMKPNRNTIKNNEGRILLFGEEKTHKLIKLSYVLWFLPTVFNNYAIFDKNNFYIIFHISSVIVSLNEKCFYNARLITAVNIFYISYIIKHELILEELNIYYPELISFATNTNIVSYCLWITAVYVHYQFYKE